MLKMILLSTVVAFAGTAFAQTEDKFEMINGEWVQTQEALSLDEIIGVEALESLDAQTTSDFINEASDEQEPEFQNMIQKASTGGSVRANLVLVGGLYQLQVSTPGGSYSCLASPGKGGSTPRRFQNKQAYNTTRLHVVSGRKSYRGAKMPFAVWIEGDYAIHAGHVTGRRESHGCIRLACAQRFYNDALKYGVRNTYVTVTNN